MQRFLGRTLTLAARQAPLLSTRHLSVTPQLLGELSPDLKKKVEDLVGQADVVLFMKGTREEPQCGFSRTAKQVLEFHNVEFKTVNVLKDDEIRQAIKEYSDWPTIPQVYVKGQFVGGCDILLQMHKDGEFTDVFEQHGVKSKFSDQEK